MGRSRYHFIYPDQPHFMTLTVQGWLPVFTRPETVHILLDSFCFLMLEYLKQQRAVTQLNQFQQLKLSHEINIIQQLWLEGIQPPKVGSRSEVMRQKIDYIHHNPVKRGCIE